MITKDTGIAKTLLRDEIEPGGFDRRSFLQGQLRSANHALEHIFDRVPKYVNREATLPCEVADEPVFLDPLVGLGSLGPFFRNHQRVIVTPETVKNMSESQLAQITVLASPYECGRVLELDRKIDIDGMPCTITVKGAGSTKFARDTGGENPFMLAIHRYFTAQEKESLTRFPFYQHYGVLDHAEALEQLAHSQELRAKGVDTERILAIYRITHLPDVLGELRPIEYFKTQGLIRSDWEPVLMFRAAKSNLRLLDAVMLEELGHKAALPTFYEHCLREYESYQQTRDPALKEYLAWLAKKVMRQEIPLILNGYEMSSGRWQDLARNISIMGEELDTVDLHAKPRGFYSLFDYYDHVRSHFGNLDTSLRRFASLAAQYTCRDLDFTELADEFYNEIEATLAAVNLQEIFSRIGGQDTYGETVQRFAAQVRWALFDHFQSFHVLGNGMNEFENHICARIERART